MQGLVALMMTSGRECRYMTLFCAVQSALVGLLFWFYISLFPESASVKMNWCVCLKIVEEVISFPQSFIGPISLESGATCGSLCCSVPARYLLTQNMRMLRNSWRTKYDPTEQCSPTFLAPGVNFMEDSFSMYREWGNDFGMIQANYIYCALYHSWVGKESAWEAGDPSLIPGSGRYAGEGIGYPLQYSWACLVAQLVKNPPAMRETWVWSLGWDDPLEKGKAACSSVLAWRIRGLSPWGRRVWHDWATFTFTFFLT